MMILNCHKLAETMLVAVKSHWKRLCMAVKRHCFENIQCHCAQYRLAAMEPQGLRQISSDVLNQLTLRANKNTHQLDFTPNLNHTAFISPVHEHRVFLSPP
jgi:phosphoglucomutase